MAGFLDRFRSPEKVQERELQLAKERAAMEAARLTAEAQAQEAERARQRREDEARANAEWEYRENIDEMRGTKMEFAQLTSENAVEFPFPYNGGSHLLLVIRKSAGQTELLIQTLNGQFSSSYGGTYQVSTKADSGSIRQWPANEPDNYSTDILFVSDPRGFIKMLQGAARVFVELEFYDSGRQQFKFNPAGLDKKFRA